MPATKQWRGRRRTKIRTTVLFIRGIDLETHSRFKAYCSRRAVTMTKEIISYMRRISKKEGTIPEIREQIQGATEELQEGQINGQESTG